MPLHTLMFGWEYPPRHSGGLGVACEGLVRGLTRGGVRVTLVLPHAAESDHDQLEIRSLSDIGGGPMITEMLPLAYEAATDYVTRLEGDRRGVMIDASAFGQAVEQYTEASVEMTKDLEPDAIHAHDWMTFEAGARAAAYHQKPFIAHIHATELDRTDGNPNPWIEERERRGLIRADGIIAVSRYTKDILVREYGIPANKITVVHNGHDMHDSAVRPVFASKNGRKRPPLVLFLGRLTVQKNPVQFLQVASIIHRIKPDVRFVMAGTGDMEAQLIDRACALQLANNIVFTGKVTSREARALYTGADCFVMPSLSEPFGLVALEAVAHGVPVVLSKQAGVGEVLDHAFKVDFWDTDKMADCILTILREQPLANQLRSEAPRVLQKLTWGNQAQQIHSLYKRLIHA